MARQGEDSRRVAEPRIGGVMSCALSRCSLRRLAFAHHARCCSPFSMANWAILSGFESRPCWNRICFVERYAG